MEVGLYGLEPTATQVNCNIDGEMDIILASVYLPIDAHDLTFSSETVEIVEYCEKNNILL